MPEAGAVGTVESALPDGTVRVDLGRARAVTVGPDAAVLLPRVGKVVELTCDGGRLAGLWAGLVPSQAGPTRAAGLLDVRVLTESRLVEQTVPMELVRAERSVTRAGESSTAGALRALADILNQRDTERRQMADWKQRLAEAACEHADDQGWCSTFDDFMAEWGLPGRSRWFDVDVELTGRVTIRIEAATADAAENQLTHAAVLTAAADRIDNLDYQIQDTTAA